MSNYGIGYQGSKNSIAKKIISLLPSADNFYDLFCGGCSITEVAMLSKKWKNIYFNDIQKELPELFINAIRGKYKDEKRWISREDFEKLKDTDIYVRLCWSFGNNSKGYLYNKEIEPYKKAYWYAVMYDDFTLFRDLGINIPKINAKTYKEKRLEISRWLKDYRKRCNRDQALERLERLQNLQSLEALERLQNLYPSGESYENIEIKENSVVYCDIPYEDTAGYGKEFNHKKFYDWAYNQKELVVISSYYISDDRFIRVVNLNKRANFSQGGYGKKLPEGLFIAKDKKDLWLRYRNRKTK